MKKLLFAIVFCGAIMLSSCIDEKYDLSNIDSDDITIGGDESEFFMPLATINYAANSIKTNTRGGTINDLFEEINKWLPSTLPGNESYVDLQRMEEKEYKTEILNSLYDEILVNEKKRTDVCEYVLENHKNELVSRLRTSENAVVANGAILIMATSVNEGVEILSRLIISYPQDVRTIFNSLSDYDLIDYRIEDIYIEIPALDISDDVVQMLSGNLDPESVGDPVNALYIFGSIYSELPLMLQINPYIENTGISLGDISLDEKKRTEFEDIRVNSGDLQVVVDGANLIIPVTLQRYYPNSDFNEDSEIEISISLHKTGGLTL